MKTAPMGRRGLHRRIEPYQGKISRENLCYFVPTVPRAAHGGV